MRSRFRAAKQGIKPNEIQSGIMFDKKVEGDAELAERIYQLAKDLKAGKYNPLKYKGKSSTIDGMSQSEKEYVFHQVDTNVSDDEKEIGEVFRQLYNEKLDKYFLYYVKYDITGNGNHKIRRYQANDKTILD